MSKDDSDIIDVNRIMELIPHRYPILLVDRLRVTKPGETAIGYKNVTFNEPHFQGHFPGYPVMPGVLIIEAMAQTSAALAIKSLGPESEGKVVFFMSIDNARFRKPVTPGDVLELHVTKLQARASVWKFEGKAIVEGKLCAEAEFSAMVMNDKK